MTQHPYHLHGVIEFHRRFGLDCPASPRLLDRDTFLYRYQFLHEELHEFLKAQRAGDLVKAADALLDLEYVTHGTAYLMGLAPIWSDLWNEVQRANLAKERAVEAATSPRGTTLDIVKPSGWVAPDDAQRRIIEAAIEGELARLGAPA